MKILVTGCAGFIGFHVAKRLLDRGDEVLGIDNLNDYYDVSLKMARLKLLECHPEARSSPGTFTFLKLDISDRVAMERLFAENQFDRVIHLAAQAGVRYSLENPHVYVQSNVVGFLNVLEGCRSQWTNKAVIPADCKPESHEDRAANTNPEFRIPGPGSRVPSPGFRHLVYASSSSVYGSNNKLPFSVEDRCDHPISLYAATKRADELMAHTYSHLYGIPTTGLRFFSVYGPWGRPDMALFKFTKAILNGDPIDVYNEGKMNRDFTYIDDIVEGVLRITDHIPSPLVGEGKGEGTGGSRPEGFGVPCALRLTPYALFNLGSHSPVELVDFINAIEDAAGKKAKLNFLPMQPGDVPATYADIDDLSRDIGFTPKTAIRDGINRFVDWYISYYGHS